MRFFNFGRESGSRKIEDRVRNLFKELEKDYLKLLIVFDEKGLPIYSFSKTHLFDDRESWALLQLHSFAKKLIFSTIEENSLLFLRELLNYNLDSINIKFGPLRFWVVSNDSYYLIALVDEAFFDFDLRDFENLLLNKLNRLKELNLIEDYHD